MSYGKRINRGIALAALAGSMCAVPAAAQERGTMEFGGFASAASFDNSLSLKTAYGAGGRIGMFLDRRWSVEFEDAEMRATRPNGLRDVNVGILSGRIVNEPLKAGRLSLLIGAGAGVSTETNFLHSYGLDGMVGGKLAVGSNMSLRLDGVWDVLANEKWKSYRSVRLGVSVFRRPARPTITRMEAPMAESVVMQQNDSVSAVETRRLRERDAALSALRDSLRNARRPMGPTTSAATLQTMQAQIHFAFDKSDLSDEAKAILDDKVALFKANPEMTVELVGFTDVTGTDAYNMQLGERRAEAAKAYIVSHGVSADRVLMESKGERAQVPNTAGAAGEAQNRRAVFRLLIVPAVVKP